MSVAVRYESKTTHFSGFKVELADGRLFERTPRLVYVQQNQQKKSDDCRLHYPVDSKRVSFPPYKRP
jgi:hypothetical protein